MFELSEHMSYSTIILIAVSVFISIYCCVCFILCRRGIHKGSTTTTPHKVITAMVSGRFIKVHRQEPPGHARPCQEYPILQRTTMPTPAAHGSGSSISTVSSLFHFHRPHTTTFAVIDPQIKLSFNPNFIAAEPPPSYDALFP